MKAMFLRGANELARYPCQDVETLDLCVNSGILTVSSMNEAKEVVLCARGKKRDITDFVPSLIDKRLVVNLASNEASTSLTVVVPTIACYDYTIHIGCGTLVARNFVCRGLRVNSFGGQLNLKDLSAPLIEVASDTGQIFAVGLRGDNHSIRTNSGIATLANSKGRALMAESQHGCVVVLDSKYEDIIALGQVDVA